MAVGSVELNGASYLQYERFMVLQGFGRNHGTVDYTNWQYAEPGTGVYAPEAAPITLTFGFGGGSYVHTLDGAGLKLTALSPERLAFSGTGVYSDGVTTWKKDRT